MTSKIGNSEGTESEEQSLKVSVASDSELFWGEYAKKIVNDTIDGLDDRAKFMITTCSSLVIIDFGLLLAFKTSGISLQIAPALFFVISAALFVLSYFPLSKEFNLQVPKEIESCYDYWREWKLRWHRIGFGFFLAGLLALALTSLI